MAEVLNPSYTQIDLSGGTENINLADGYDQYIFYNTGTLTGDYEIQPNGSAPTSTLRINILKVGAIDLGGYNFTIFGQNLTQEQANCNLIITCIYDLVTTSWTVDIQINSIDLPTSLEQVNSITTPTSGTITLDPNIDPKWLVLSSQTLVGNLTIDGTNLQNGTEFWVKVDGAIDVNGNTLSIFGLNISSKASLTGNFTVVGKYDGSTWQAVFVNSIVPLFVEGAGTGSIKVAGSTLNTASGNNSYNFSKTTSQASADGAVNFAYQGEASGINAFTQGIDTTANGSHSIATGNQTIAEGTSSFSQGYQTHAEGTYSSAMGNQNHAEGIMSQSTGNQSHAKWFASKTHSSGNPVNNKNFPSQNIEAQLYRTTTNATLTELFLDGTSAKLVLTPDSTMLINGKLTGIQTNGSSGSVGDTKSWEFICKAVNNSGTVTLKSLDYEGSSVIYKTSLRNIGNVHLTGTAQAGGANTMTLDGAAPMIDTWFNHCYITILSGTGAGQSRLIIDYVGSTQVATVNSNWSVTPDNTSVYAIVYWVDQITDTDKWYPEIGIDGANSAVYFKVKGEVNKTIYWHLDLNIQEICF